MGQQFTGKVEFLNAKGKIILTIDPDSGFIQMVLKTPSGFEVMNLTNTGSFTLGGGGNDWGTRLDGMLGHAWVGAKKRAGKLFVRDSDANDSIILDGEKGDIILTNADCAEDFDLESAGEVEPGTVMVLGPEGALRCSSEPYDKAVAGVVSGGGAYKPGIVLDRRPSDARRVPLALVGKVYCKVDATRSPVGVGDLLTTSPTPGHAMKATDQRRAFGAVLGKALRPLEAGSGLIPVLVALQ